MHRSHTQTPPSIIISSTDSLILYKGKIKSPPVKYLRNKILAYSAIKIRANPPEPYSILKPDTNSDSPSAKSNGERLVSATQQTNHSKINGVLITI